MYRFKECREAARISQKAAAITLGVSAPSMSAWENGKNGPTIENLIAMTKLYGVTADELLGLSDGKTVRLSRDEKTMVLAYRKTDPGIRRAVQVLLGLTATEEEEKITSRA